VAQVEMLVNTFYKQPLRPGDIVEVDTAVAARWERNGIAKWVANAPDDPSAFEVAPPPEEQPKPKRGGKKNDAE